MDPKAFSFLKSERICALGVLLQGTEPHVVVVHYSVNEDPLKLYIQTSNTTVKARPFLDGSSGKAAIAVGFDEKDWVTLQLSGHMRMVPPEDLEGVSAVHYARHPGARSYMRPDTIFLEFTPSDWKYSDYKTTPVTFLQGVIAPSI